MTLMLERLHFAHGLNPVANAFAGTVYSDIYNMAQHGRCLLVVWTGVGTTGTQTLTVEACDGIAGSNVSAVPFWSRSVPADSINVGDTEAAWVRRAAAGYTTVAGSHRFELCEVDAKDLAASGYGYVRLKSVEVAASAVLGGMFAILGGAPARYSRQANATVIT